MHRVREIIGEVLDVPTNSIDGYSGPRNFAQWDSAAQIDIVLSLEAEYGVCFSAQEMAETVCVQTLEDCLHRKGVVS